jgi:hypothetical protein
MSPYMQSEKPTTEHYPDPDESNPHPLSIYLKLINTIFPEERD